MLHKCEIRIHCKDRKNFSSHIENVQNISCPNGSEIRMDMLLFCIVLTY